MRIVTSTEHVGTQCGDIFTILDVIRAAGYDSVDFNANNYCYPGLKYGDTPFYSDDWKPWIQKVRSHADALGLKIVQSHNLIFNYFSLGEETALFNRMVLRAIDASALLGAENTVIHPVTPPGVTSRELERCLEMNAQYYYQCIKHSAAQGITVLTENMMSPRNEEAWHYCDTTEDLMTLVDAVGEESFGVCFDTGHAHYMGNDIYDTIIKMGKRIKGLHIHDNNGSDDQHLVMYSGTLDWDRFMKGIVDCGYTGHFALESFRTTIRLPLELKVGMLREILEISRFMVSKIEEMRKLKPENYNL